MERLPMPRQSRATFLAEVDNRLVECRKHGGKTGNTHPPLAPFRSAVGVLGKATTDLLTLGLPHSPARFAL